MNKTPRLATEAAGAALRDDYFAGVFGATEQDFKRLTLQRNLKPIFARSSPPAKSASKVPKRTTARAVAIVHWNTRSC